MDLGYGDLDSRGFSFDPLPPFATHPWPLDCQAPDLFPHFVSPPTLPPLFQCSSSPYLQLPNMMQMNPLPDFLGQYYKRPSDRRNFPLYQEPCSSSIFPGVDSQISTPCLVQTGFPESRRAPYSYAKSTQPRDETIPLGSQCVENLQIAAMPILPPIFPSNLVFQREVGEPESHSTLALITSTGKEPPSSLESIPVPSKIPRRGVVDTVLATTSTTKSGNSYSSSYQTSRAERFVTTATRCKNQGPKRRKAQQKRVVCVPATGGTDKPTGECIPSDTWAWRKYGQKPIKGSPYPRGYYRCSSCKGCTARKQVERSRTDPTMLVITYSSDHNHAGPTRRNGLSVTTGQSSPAKPSPNSAPALSDGTCEPSDNSLSSIVNSPTTHEDPVGSPTVTTKDSTSTLDYHANLDVPSDSDKWDDDFFTQLDQLSDCFFMPTSLDDRSDEDQCGNHTVDPYNLFDWSSNSIW